MTVLTEPATLELLIIAGGALGGGILVALAYRYVVLSVLRRRVERWGWTGGSALLGAIGAMPVLWALLAGLYGALRALPLRPAFLDALETGLMVVLVVSVTWVAARIAAGLVRAWAERSDGALPASSIFTNLTMAVVAVLGLLVLLQYLGVSITPMLTALGVGGLAVALALQDTLSNIFAGFHILASRQVAPGDYVKLSSGDEGYVEDITWRNTRIRAIPNNMVIVPNATLASSIVTNYFLPEREMGVQVELGVSYASDLEHVERVTLEVARETMEAVPCGVPDFEPRLRYHTFGDSSIDFRVVLRVTEFGDSYQLAHEFIKRLHARYRREGIEIPFPIRTVHMRGEEATPVEVD